MSPRCRSSLAGPPPRPSYREKLTTQRCIYHPLDQPATLAGSTKVWSHTGIGDNAIGLVLSGHLCSIHVGEHFIYMLFTSLPIFPVHAGLCAPFSRRCLASLRPSSLLTEPAVNHQSHGDSNVDSRRTSTLRRQRGPCAYPRVALPGHGYPLPPSGCSWLPKLRTLPRELLYESTFQSLASS